MMGRSIKIDDVRPAGKRVRQTVTLSDGKVIEFDVLVLESPGKIVETRARPRWVNEHGMVPRVGSSS